MSKDYEVRYRDLGYRSTNLENIVKKWKSALSEVDGKVAVLKGTDSISGATADRMRQYFGDIHGNIHTGFQTLLDMLQATWDMYFTTYTGSIDPFPDSIIFVTYADSLKKKMNDYCGESEDIDSEVTKILNRIDDIYSSPYGRAVTDATIYETNAENIKNLCDAIDAHETGYADMINGELSEMLGYISATIKANYAQNAMYKCEYTGQGNGSEYEYMLAYTSAVRTYMDGNKEAIENARSGVEKHAEDLKAYDIEMAERERREKEAAAAKTGVIIVGIIVTAGVTVATGGTGTAFVVASIGAGFATGAAEGAVDAWSEGYIEGGWDGVDWGKVGRSAFVGGIKGAVVGGISAGAGTAFSKLGKVGMIAEAGKSSNFLIKHGSKLGMKVIEGGITDVATGMTERFITSGSEAWVNDGKSGFDIEKAAHEAFDKEAIIKDVAESTTDTVTGYVVEEGLGSIMGVKDIERDSLITSKDVGQKAVIGGTNKVITGISKRYVGTYVENKLIGMDSDEAREAAAKEAVDGEKIIQDVASGTFKGATEPYTDRAKKQKEYEDTLAKQIREDGKKEKLSEAEIEKQVKTKIDEEHTRWKEDLAEQKAEQKRNAEIETNIREKGTANTNDEIKILNEMRENGELDIEDDPDEKIRKNVNSGNYAHEREQLKEMYENGELDDDYSDSGKAKADAGTAKADDGDSGKAKTGTAAAATAGGVGNGDSEGGKTDSDDADSGAEPEKKTKTSTGAQEDTASGDTKKVPTMANAYEMADDPDLFKDYEAGDISYGETEDGKVAYGSLKYNEDPDRNQYAQRTAGGKERRPDDHGGHLIAAGENGDPGEKNIVAMNDDLNTGRYKKQEMKEIEALKDGTKVFKYVETYGTGGTERPDTIMGYTITETPDGKRDVEYFHTVNESSETLEEWDAIANSEPTYIPEGMTAAEYHGMSEAEYAETQRIFEEEGY